MARTKPDSLPTASMTSAASSPCVRFSLDSENTVAQHGAARQAHGSIGVGAISPRMVWTLRRPRWRSSRGDDPDRLAALRDDRRTRARNASHRSLRLPLRACSGGATANRGLQGCGTKALEGPERNLRRAKRGGVCISPSECTKQATRGPKRRRCGPMWQGLTGSVTGKRPVGRAYGVVCLSRCCCTHSSRWASCAHAASPVAAAAHP